MLLMTFVDRCGWSVKESVKCGPLVIALAHLDLHRRSLTRRSASPSGMERKHWIMFAGCLAAPLPCQSTHMQSAWLANMQLLP